MYVHLKLILINAGNLPIWIKEGQAPIPHVPYYCPLLAYALLCAMEILAHSNHPDVRENTFIGIEGNQYNNTYSGTVYCFSVFGAGPGSRRIAPDHSLRPITDSDTPPQISPSPLGNDLTTQARHSVDPVSVISTALVLIDSISTSLIDPTDFSKNCHELQPILEALRQSLCLVKRAIKPYKGTPLCRSLASTIIPDVKQCVMLLSELHSKLHKTWASLACTRISNLWRQVFREQWEADELAALKRRLCYNRNSLWRFLLTLNS